MKKIAILAALDINEAEMPLIKKDVENIIDYIEQIKSYDIGNIPAEDDLDSKNNVLREDDLEESSNTSNKDMNENKEMLLKNGPKVENGFLVVPKTT